MLPLKDENPTKNLPFMTIILILIMVGCFFIIPNEEITFQQYGVIPADIKDPNQGLLALFFSDRFHTIFSSIFLHAGVQHIFMNALFLWIFGNNIEDELGPIMFLVFFLVCGFCAALMQIFTNPTSAIPMVGSSGAVSGIMGAYILLFPRAKVITFFIITIVRWPAMVYIGLWFAYQAAQVVYYDTGYEAGVAWWAHIGGFLAGLFLINVMNKKKRYGFRPGGRKRGKLPNQ